MSDSWFYACWYDLPESPRTATSDTVTCCKYHQWFAKDGGPIQDPLPFLDRGRWQDGPDYVRRSANMSRCKLRSLASFRVAAHDLEIETQKWSHQVIDGTRVRVPLPREERLCQLCGTGVGDEKHMIAECSAYAAVRQRHSHLFGVLGGWQQVVHRAVPAADMRRFMSQDQHLVASFLYDCSQRRWQNPPAELLEAVEESDDDDLINAALVGTATLSLAALSGDL